MSPISRNGATAACNPRPDRAESQEAVMFLALLAVTLLLSALVS